MEMSCDRCEKKFDGRTVDCGNGLYITEGFYEVGPKSRAWKKFGNGGEEIICTKCMKKDSRYQAIYGNHKNAIGE